MTLPDELSLRLLPAGGDLRVTVEAERQPVDRVWIVFIHGFNVSRADARTQYDKLRSSADRRLPSGYGGAWRLVQWPSDRGRRPFSKVLYPALVPVAASAGRRLGSFLSVFGPPRVILVGHSLGAVVALHAARRLGPGRVAGLALLAGAVQVSEFDDNGRPIPPLAGREAVGFNPLDLVLLAAFPIGERVAANGRRSSPAVGLRGQPRPRWEERHTRFNGLGHASWADPLAAKVLGDAVGERPVEPVPRRPPERHVDERPDVLARGSEVA